MKYTAEFYSSHTDSTLHNKQARTPHRFNQAICANAHFLPIRHFMSSNTSFTSSFHIHKHISLHHTRISFNPVPFSFISRMRKFKKRIFFKGIFIIVCNTRKHFAHTFTQTSYVHQEQFDIHIIPSRL